MDFKIIPCIGTDILKLGLTSSQNTAILKKIPEKFHKSRKKDEPDIMDDGAGGFVSLKNSIGFTIEEGLVTSAMIAEDHYFDFWLDD